MSEGEVISPSAAAKGSLWSSIKIGPVTAALVCLKGEGPARDSEEAEEGLLSQVLPNGEAANALLRAAEGGMPSEPERCLLPATVPALAVALMFDALVDVGMPVMAGWDGVARGKRDGWPVVDGIPAAEEAACRMLGRCGVTSEGPERDVGSLGMSVAGRAKGGSSFDGMVLRVSTSS